MSTRQEKSKSAEETGSVDAVLQLVLDCVNYASSAVETV
jgi:hypothetical protein